jgi:transposase
VRHHGMMDAYSEDLRRKIVEAVERRRMNQSEVARVFGVSLSSVKRYVKAVRQGRSLSPGKAPGNQPTLDEKARKLLVGERIDPFEDGIRSMGFGRKKGRWVRVSATSS